MQTPALTAAPAASAKFALCIDRAHAPEAYRSASTPAAIRLVGLDFFNTQARLIDRAVCESDEGTLQLIPYIVLLNLHTGAIFCYSRGDGGQEDRLHGKLSIGLGGHVDEAPQPTSPQFYPAAFYQLLDAEAQRELREEAGLSYKGHLIFHALLCDPCDPVGRVHVGLLTVASVTDVEIAGMQAESGVIERGYWIDPTALRNSDVFARLEPWSKAALDFILH